MPLPPGQSYQGYHEHEDEENKENDEESHPHRSTALPRVSLQSPALFGHHPEIAFELFLGSLHNSFVIVQSLSKMMCIALQLRGHVGQLVCKLLLDLLRILEECGPLRECCTGR